MQQSHPLVTAGLQSGLHVLCMHVHMHMRMLSRLPMLAIPLLVQHLAR